MLSRCSISLVLKIDSEMKTKKTIDSIFGPNENYLGEPVEVFQFEMTSAGFFGRLPLEGASRNRRQASIFNTNQIANPALCLLEGEMVIFNLDINENNRNLSIYPKYQVESLFNRFVLDENITDGSEFRTHDHMITFQYHFSNPNFDYGEFRQLEDLILNGIDVTFDKAGFQIDNSSSRSLY